MEFIHCLPVNFQYFLLQKLFVDSFSLFQMKMNLKIFVSAFLIGIFPTESSPKKKGQGDLENFVFFFLICVQKSQCLKVSGERGETFY